jgi:hypothetical protein
MPSLGVHAVVQVASSGTGTKATSPVLYFSGVQRRHTAGGPSSADSGGTMARGHSASPGTTLLGSRRGHRDHRRLHEAPRRLSRGFYRGHSLHARFAVVPEQGPSN